MRARVAGNPEHCARLRPGSPRRETGAGRHPPAALAAHPERQAQAATSARRGRNRPSPRHPRFVSGKGRWLARPRRNAGRGAADLDRPLGPRAPAAHHGIALLVAQGRSQDGSQTIPLTELTRCRRRAHAPVAGQQARVLAGGSAGGRGQAQADLRRSISATSARAGRRGRGSRSSRPRAHPPKASAGCWRAISRCSLPITWSGI
jgi:hypothetical protein